jgi:O-acetyl-ADP-ribose deacetylase (regulator of RNase III)
VDVGRIYTLGGAVSAHQGGLYLPRKADEELLQSCRKGENVYVFAPRQMGKTSLAVSVARQLSETKIHVALIDLSILGTNLSDEQWYLNLVVAIADSLKIKMDVAEWWKGNDQISAIRRLHMFFEKVLPESVRKQIVVLIDEFDAAQRPGDFLSLSRSLYNMRDTSPGLRRISFVLFGVLPPDQLQPDSPASPFINSARAIELTDYTYQEALPLANGLRLPAQHAEQVLAWVLDWTGGHPYLTQRLCSVIADKFQSSWSEADVEKVVAETFFGDKGLQDSNLMYVSSVLANPLNEQTVLSVYLGILKGIIDTHPARLKVDERQALSLLLSSGVVVRKGAADVRVRNRIYSGVFNDDWLVSQMTWAQLNPLERLDLGPDELAVARRVLPFLVTASGTRHAITVSGLSLSSHVLTAKVAPVVERLVSLGVLRATAPAQEVNPEPRYEIASDSIAAKIKEWLADGEQAQEETEQDAAPEFSVEAEEHSFLTSLRVYVSGVYPELRQEREAVKSVLLMLKERFFEGLEYFVSRQNKEGLSLWELERSSIYICIIGESYGSGLTEKEYRRAEELGIPRLVYIKELEGFATGSDGPSSLSEMRQPRFKEHVSQNNTVRYFGNPAQLGDWVATDLRKWLDEQGLPALLKGAAEPDVPVEVGRSLLSRIKNSSDIDPALLSRLEARVSETKIQAKYWFYFSYERDAIDDYLRQFYQDLRRTIGQLTGAGPHEIGFFDQEDIYPGEPLPGAIVDALQASRVFVSIFTPGYFQSELCGQEWQVFASRLKEAASPVPPLILPVLWSSPANLPRPLPEAAANIHYAREEYGGAYLEAGLRALMRRAESEEYYLYGNFLLSFAERLVEVAKSYEIPALPTRPVLEYVRSAFHQADAPDTDEPEATSAPQRRYVLVAGTGTYGLPENVRKVSVEVGKALARNGYGLVVGGWSGVDYVVSEAFATELRATDRSLSDYLIQVVPIDTQPQFSGGKIIYVQQGQAEFSEQIKQVDAVILIGGLGGTYSAYQYAREAQKPVFPVAGTGTDALTAFNEIIERWKTEHPAGIDIERFRELAQNVETDLDVQKVVGVLLELLDGLRANARPTMSEADALARLVFVKGNLLEQPVDALINAVGTNPRSSDLVGQELLEIFGPDFYSGADFEKTLRTGETLVSKVGDRLPASYVIHTCSEATTNVHTVASVVQAVKGALDEAERLHVQTIAFPSIGTGAAGLEVSSIARRVLEAVINHMQRGSMLEKVVFAFNNNEAYRAYLDAYRKMGGVGVSALLPRLTVSSRRALGFAEALRQHVGHHRINTRILLWGLYQKRDGAARALLTAISSAAEIEEALHEWIGVENTLSGIEPVPDSALAHVNLSPHCQRAFVNALELAGDSKVVRERQVLGGLLGVSNCRASRWIEQISGLNAGQLWDIVAVRNEDEGQPIAPQIRSLLARQAQVATQLWRLKLSEPQADGQNAAELRVGEKQTHRLDLLPALPTDDEEGRSHMLRIPANTLELTGYIKAHGFHLHGDSIFTIPVTGGRPTQRSINFELTPLMSGLRTVQVEVYPGGRIQGLRPSIVSHNLRVASPVALPDIKELIDRRRIPNPQPDVMLYVALEELPDGQRTRIYLTCPMLNLDREPLEPLMLDARSLAELRRMAIQTAAGATHLSPQDVLAAMRGFGAMLFEKIMPASLQEYYVSISQLAAASTTPWSWLIISDENAILPWELVCYYSVETETGKIWYDDFLADRFFVAHWVGQRGLRLVSEAPVGKLDLIHYAQSPGELPQWLAALGGEEHVQAEEGAGHISLLQPGSYFYGLHLLRYTEQRRSDRIVAASPGVKPEQESERSEGEDITYEQRLDLTLRRPTVGLSFVNTSPPGRVAALSQCDTRLESNWMIPLMHAGASALIGTRWPVSQESDLSFLRQFYQAMRDGESLGAAVWSARQRVRAAFPHRPDWLAYTYFGHPQCEPYPVRPAQGFTLFEAIDQPDDVPFLAGGTYHFRASYRSEAPAWYNGRLRTQEGPLQSDDVSVVVMPLSGVMPKTYKLNPVPQSDDLQCTVPLTMPDTKTNLPVMVRFQKGSEELRTITLNLQVEEGLAR